MVLGLDLSLTSTGMAEIIEGAPRAWSIKPPPAHRGHDRLHWLVDTIWATACEYEGGHLVVVEGPSYGSQASGRGHERAGLWWLLTHQLWSNGIEMAVVSPAALKKYATGKGNAGKDEVLMATARRFPDFDGGNDAADALWLAAMGADHAGVPIVTVPAPHRQALAKVEWPAVIKENA